MWSSEPWDEIKFYFPQLEDNESRIVVTSRQSQLVGHLTSSPCFPLHLLNKENSWILFSGKVFGDKQGCPHELKVVGHKIIKKCRGLPLAIVVVGGHLRNSLRTQGYWENVANNMDSILSSDVNESCLDILSLSYSYLPVHLKPCFLYMGIFEEDQRINVSRLIKLWIGEGFIKPSKTQSLEEVAEGCLKDLVDRNLILACQRNWNGKIKSCELHDIVRELCVKIVRKEKFLCVLNTQEVVNREGRVAIRGGSIKPGSFGKRHIPSLRVLNGVEGKFLEVDWQLISLRHLHYFMKRNIDISRSISLFWTLQTLIVKGLHQSIVAPHEFWEILQLRHLEMDKISLPDPLPSDRGKLVSGNLQTLLGVENLKLSEEVCKRISDIKELSIIYTFGSYNKMSLYCLHNLSLVHKLESLECSFYWCGFARSFTFPGSLKELSLTRCRLLWQELSMMAGSLPLLETLSLRFNAIIESQWNTIEGHFDHLKSFTIYCENLVDFNVDCSHFPALRHLCLRRLPKLDRLPSCIGELPSLQRISVWRCSVLLAMSAMRILVEQEQEYGNESLQLQVSFWHEPEKKKRFEKEIHEEGLKSNNLHLLEN